MADLQRAPHAVWFEVQQLFTGSVLLAGVESCGPSVSLMPSLLLSFTLCIYSTRHHGNKQNQCWLSGCFDSRATVHPA